MANFLNANIKQFLISKLESIGSIKAAYISALPVLFFSVISQLSPAVKHIHINYTLQPRNLKGQII